MCTAATYYAKDHYFGRNLDLEFSYHEEITIVPRNYPFIFRKCEGINHHYAMIGTAFVVEGYPLFYDAVNEKGLGIAGLNFPGNAAYKAEVPDADNVAPFEFIPWILSRCADVDEAKGIRVYDDPVGVMTNNPTFDQQMFHLSNYMHLSNKPVTNTFAKGLEITEYSRGMGAMGMPGDLSSASRFVKAAFTRMNSVSGNSEEESVSQFFHILGSVEQQRGCVCLGEGKYEITVYSSCCNMDRGIYYYRTYENSQITAVDMHKEATDGEALIRYPMIKEQQIRYQN